MEIHDGGNVSTEPHVPRRAADRARSRLDSPTETGGSDEPIGRAAPRQGGDRDRGLVRHRRGDGGGSGGRGGAGGGGRAAGRPAAGARPADHGGGRGGSRGR